VTFYHGTASTFEQSILQHGLRHRRRNKWSALATQLDGKPITALDVQGAVWMTDNFELAVQYARLKARLLRADQGEEVEWGTGGPLALWFPQRVFRIRKASPVCDPDSQAIIFATEVNESEKRIQANSLTSKMLRAIPSQALTLIRLRHEMTVRTVWE
jgi:hypothetical protein